MLRDQAVPGRLDRCGEGGGDLVAYRRFRTLRGPAECDELDDVQPLAWLEGSGDGHPAEIGKALGRNLHIRRSLDPMVHGGGDPQSTGARAVHQQRPAVTAGVGLRPQRHPEHSRGPGIGTGRRKRLVGNQLRLDHYPDRVI